MVATLPPYRGVSAQAHAVVLTKKGYLMKFLRAFVVLAFLFPAAFVQAQDRDDGSVTIDEVGAVGEAALLVADEVCLCLDQIPVNEITVESDYQPTLRYGSAPATESVTQFALIPLTYDSVSLDSSPCDLQELDVSCYCDSLALENTMSIREALELLWELNDELAAEHSRRTRDGDHSASRQIFNNAVDMNMEVIDLLFDAAFPECESDDDRPVLREP